jgi:hypothetical protein
VPTGEQQRVAAPGQGSPADSSAEPVEKSPSGSGKEGSSRGLKAEGTLQDALARARERVREQAARARAEAAQHNGGSDNDRAASTRGRIPTGPPFSRSGSAGNPIATDSALDPQDASHDEDSTASTVAATPQSRVTANDKRRKRTPTPSRGPRAVYERQRTTTPPGSGPRATPQPEFGRLITGPIPIQPRLSGPVRSANTGPLKHQSTGPQQPAASIAGRAKADATPSSGVRQHTDSMLDEVSSGQARFRAFAYGVVAAIMIFVAAFSIHWLYFRNPPRDNRPWAGARPRQPISGQASKESSWCRSRASRGTR